MGDTQTGLVEQARRFLGGKQIPFDDADALWRALKGSNELALARMVLQEMRTVQGCVVGPIPFEKSREHRREEAMLISKDDEQNSATRHDVAFEVLASGYPLDDVSLDGDSETLGIAGGICKRRWNDLGQLADLKRAAGYYGRGASGPLGDDAYTQINAAFLDDVLAANGDDPDARRQRAKGLRTRITKELTTTGTWWNAASLAEAFFGLGDYANAIKIVKEATSQPAPWQLQTTARQISDLAHLLEPRPFDNPGVREFFQELLPGADDAIRSVSVGKIGLALSGGGFRASFFHLGVLAFLAERNILRNIDVLSCVSGGSIVGASYWLALRKRLLDPQPMTHDAYLDLVDGLIADFGKTVSGNLRREVQSIPRAILGFLGTKGALSPEKTAAALERLFYQPSWKDDGPIYMDELPFTPADHDKTPARSQEFNPAKHNWLRAHKVPALILNATTVNTGHAWQFTPTWMGEAPWSIYGAADSVRRLQWANYDKGAGWRIQLGRAVAASACVPFIFAPLKLDAEFDDKELGKMTVSLIDGGVFDNQGTVSLLASNCNVLLVSDSCGQLMLEQKLSWLLIKYAMRTMDALMERVRLANYGDLDARRRSGLLRGLMFLHMKSGLDADIVRLKFSQDTYRLVRSILSPSGVRKDFQQALSELRTDLDDFSPEEQNALMACGYQMASHGFEKDLKNLAGLWDAPKTRPWPFAAMLTEVTSTAPSTPRREGLLTQLRKGSKLKLKLW
jgi:predicted acylesterase/phospholipase RssA